MVVGPDRQGGEHGHRWMLLFPMKVPEEESVPCASYNCLAEDTDDDVVELFGAKD